jgi:hypothetical protein
MQPSSTPRTINLSPSLRLGFTFNSLWQGFIDPFRKEAQELRKNPDEERAIVARAISDIVNFANYPAGWKSLPDVKEGIGRDMPVAVLSRFTTGSRSEAPRSEYKIVPSELVADARRVAPYFEGDSFGFNPDSADHRAVRLCGDKPLVGIFTQHYESTEQCPGKPMKGEWSAGNRRATGIRESQAQYRFQELSSINDLKDEVPEKSYRFSREMDAHSERMQKLKSQFAWELKLVNSPGWLNQEAVAHQPHVLQEISHGISRSIDGYLVVTGYKVVPSDKLDSVREFLKLSPQVLFELGVQPMITYEGQSIYYPHQDQFKTRLRSFRLGHGEDMAYLREVCEGRNDYFWMKGDPNAKRTQYTAFAG